MRTFTAAVAMTVAVQITGTAPANAHGTTIAIAISDDASDKTDVVAGLRLAIDQSPDVGHAPGPDAGDHLGGVDVDLLRLDGRARELEVSLPRAIREGASLVVVVGDLRMATAAKRALGSKPILLVAALPSDVRRNDLPSPMVLLRGSDYAAALTSADEFTQDFRSANGREPSQEAAVGYDVGQFLDLLIGETDGDRPTSTALTATLSGAPSRLTVTSAEYVQTESPRRTRPPPRPPG